MDRVHIIPAFMLVLVLFLIGLFLTGLYNESEEYGVAEKQRQVELAVPSDYSKNISNALGQHVKSIKEYDLRKWMVANPRARIVAIAFDHRGSENAECLIIYELTEEK